MKRARRTTRVAQQLATQNLVRTLALGGERREDKTARAYGKRGFAKLGETQKTALRHDGVTPPHVRWSLQRDMMRRGIKL